MTYVLSDMRDCSRKTSTDMRQKNISGQNQAAVSFGCKIEPGIKLKRNFLMFLLNL